MNHHCNQNDVCPGSGLLRATIPETQNWASTSYPAAQNTLRLTPRSPMGPPMGRKPRCNQTTSCFSDYPVGMGYVPMQRWGQTYPVSQGLLRGTIFPELDLTFMYGRCRR